MKKSIVFALLYLVTSIYCKNTISILDTSVVIADDTLMEVNGSSYQESLRSVDFWSENDLQYVSSSINANDLFISQIEPSQGTFIQSLGLAFADHRPISISPDDIWLVIMQAISKQVAYEPKKFETLIMDKNYKEDVYISENELLENPTPSDWGKIVYHFVDSTISRTNSETRNLLINDFTTSDDLSKLVMRTTYLSITNKYIEYLMATLCGIPEIKLKGTKEDWMKLRSGFIDLTTKLKMNWWASELVPVIDEFIKAYDGDVNMRFWKSIYKFYETKNSGEVDGINGWITKFVPYVNHKQRTDWTDTLCASDFTGGLTNFYFNWNYYGKVKHMRLMSGLIGSTQNKTSKEITPRMGWIIFEESRELYERRKKK